MIIQSKEKYKSFICFLQIIWQMVIIGGFSYQGVFTELKEIGETNSYILGKGPDISARQSLYICNLPLLSSNLFRLVSRLGFLHNGDNQLY